MLLEYNHFACLLTLPTWLQVVYSLESHHLDQINKTFNVSDPFLKLADGFIGYTFIVLHNICIIYYILHKKWKNIPHVRYNF